MDRIAVSTIPQLAGAPYQYLREVPEIAFEEGSPTENAKKLFSGAVDAALIPAIDFLQHGELHSLGFGLGCRSRSQSMVLYGNGRMEDLDSIRVYQSSSSSSALLKILLSRRCGRVLPFGRENRLDIQDTASERRGALVLHELPGQIDGRYRVHIDLATAWNEETKLPFVFLVWAARPRALSGAQLSKLTESLYRAVALDRVLARRMAERLKLDPALAEVFVAEDRRYYLDDFLLGGFEEFIVQSQSIGLMENVEYRVAKRSLFGSVVIRPAPERSYAAPLSAAGNHR